ncbi:MAG: peptidoglycan DD-metalloendopeptidase family protein [Anaerolineae bacterium]|nr:peptidoglycan DD-metalloendopeptidase family protein [Anaerolineae bacterium]MDW8171270.1 LysM peptidoglycan-binding domain-containing M23 family metallopeptidase [Anaerolineae bacterium]
MAHHPPQPPVDPTEDTRPTLALRPAQIDSAAQQRTRRDVLSLFGAALFTFSALAVALWPAHPSPSLDELTASDVPLIAVSPTVPEPAPANPTPVEQVVAPAPTLAQADPVANQALMVINAEVLLLTPLPSAPADPARLIAYDPFTIIPERPRSEFVEYQVQQGDSLNAIARRFGLTPDTLAWCNDRRVIFALRRGDVLQIPPVDGACHVVLGTRNETIASIAEQYQVTPTQLINSPYSNLYDRLPNDVLPGGTRLFIPGGKGETIAWNPPSETKRDASGAIISYTFAAGQPGSCGAVAPGGGSAWTNPLPNGTWMRGFYVGHSGIDLAAPPGTPIYAANSGPVLFSGYSDWGYGQTVVLAHGPFSTLYAHMSSRSVSCGQFVSAGQVVGTVGSTGNSTGPHLHFEIRYADQPQDPSGTPGIGW